MKPTLVLPSPSPGLYPSPGLPTFMKPTLALPPPSPGLYPSPGLPTFMKPTLVLPSPAAAVAAGPMTKLGHMVMRRRPCSSASCQAAFSASTWRQRQHRAGQGQGRAGAGQGRAGQGKAGQRRVGQAGERRQGLLVCYCTLYTACALMAYCLKCHSACTDVLLVLPVQPNLAQKACFFE